MPLAKKPAPYTFVPVVAGRETELPTFPAIFHEKKQDLTGELNCELTTLTPMMAGHFQYKLETALTNIAINQKDMDDKSVLEPLFLHGNHESPTLISGTTIKGMVRHNIGAMLSAPMERVQEQYFSYRPNLTITMEGCYTPREAIVREVKDLDGDSPILKVDILGGMTDAQYLTSYIYEKKLSKEYGDKFPAEYLLDMGLCKKNYRDRRGKYQIKNRIDRITRETINDSLLPKGNEFIVLKYKAGIDGNGEVAKTFAERKKDDVAVVVSTNSIKKATKDVLVDKEIIKEFFKTKRELANDKYGHVKRNTDQKIYTKGIKSPNLEVGQLIYVEINEDNNIVSFGHNFRYRWRYADSILEKSGKLRRDVDQAKNESIGKSDKSDQLTGARLLFGYVDGDENEKNKENRLKIGKEDSDYVRLAGRISINTAIEQCDDLTNLNQRFVQYSKANDNTPVEQRYTIPLKILGQPQASAVEHYLQQDSNKLQTYGDLPSVELSNSQLNGRKFYRHQPIPEGNNTLFEASTDEEIKKEQASLARFICKTGTKFRFKVRFKNLQEWELGALILALSPQLKDPKAANKLGHGRPLGLGSIKIDIQQIKLLNDKLELKEDTEEKTHYLNKLETQQGINLAQIKCWLEVLNYKNRTEAAYPRYKKEIYNYHTEIRRQYSKKRREGKAMDANYGELVKPTPKL